MPPIETDNGNGKITLAVLGERMEFMIKAQEKTNRVLEEYMKTNDARVNVLDKEHAGTKKTAEDSCSEIGILRTKIDAINARSLVWEGLNTIAIGIAAIFAERK